MCLRRPDVHVENEWQLRISAVEGAEAVILDSCNKDLRLEFKKFKLLFSAFPSRFAEVLPIPKSFVVVYPKMLGVRLL
jgi:hypothetical protein